MAWVADRRGLTVADGMAEAGLQRARREAMEALARRVAEGDSVRLLCWCYPRRCHGDWVAKHVMRRARDLLASELRGRKRSR